MASDRNAREGGCLCGAIRYRTEGPPLWAAHCHCASCRKATGAAMVTYAGYARARFAYSKGTPKIFTSSPGVMRGFCPDCGTTLTFEGTRWPDEVHVLVATLDQPDSISPQTHVHEAERIAWLKLDDGLPRFATLPSAKPPPS